jgi:CheY-like chemotaxis protein
MARILVIDDDDLVRRTLRGILERADHSVTEAADGVDGLAQATRSRPDLILTDILMPNQDGIEFIMALRQADPKVRIIAMSGGGSFLPDQLLVMAKELGADECLAKPFARAALLSKVQTCLTPTARI